MTTPEQYYIIRCFRNFNGFYKLCKQITCPYYKKKLRNTYGTLSCREAWLTPAEFTFFNLLTTEKHFTEYMVRSYGPPNINDRHINDLFEEEFGLIA